MRTLGAAFAIMLLEGFPVPVQDVSEEVAVAAEPAPVEESCGSGVNAGIASIVGLYFPEEEMCTALRIVACESLGDPGAVNPSSGATGLFQVMPFWADHYGYSRHDLLEPVLNTEIAHRIWSEEGGWQHWDCW